ncbi:N-6 DNA methylase [Ferrimonas gelatinilytica]|uniref:site-specific DNA-methyltransferase (adenine-specific) n=1 Tax=Ferrimonas gelatinilytica TaxID=1255257 RepID=A0ABP9S945_9GAMM
MKQVKEMLLKIMDQGRGKMEVHHIIDLIAYIAVVAKLHPQGFKRLHEATELDHHDILHEVSQELSERFDLNEYVVTPPPPSHIDPKTLTTIVDGLANIEDKKVLVKPLRHLAAQASRYGESSSNTSTTMLFKALIGNCHDKVVYDGACGLGGVVTDLGPKKAILEEIDLSTYTLASRLFRLDDSETEFHYGDALSKPQVKAASADIVVMEPPLNQKFSADQRRQLDDANYLIAKPERNMSANAGNVLWLQLALDKLKANGRAYILLPQGWLFRSGYDAQVRQALLELGLIEALVGLPSGLLTNTGIPTVLVVLSKAKNVDTPIHFVDASEVGATKRNQRTFNQDDVKLIAELAAGKHTADERFKAVAIDEIQSNNGSLSIGAYLAKEVVVARLSLTEELAKLAKVKNQAEQSHQWLSNLIDKVAAQTNAA